MKKKTTLILTIFGILFLAASLFYFFKTKKLKKQLEQVEVSSEEHKQSTRFFEELSQRDSLLLRGEYQKAIEFYQAELSDVEEGQQNALQLRIQLARELMRKNENLSSTEMELENELTAKTEQLTTLEDSLTARSELQGQQIDSLSFALEKAQMRQSDLEQQVRSKPEREYVTFTSSKGNQVHFIGEVKNGKANGEGIGLWSTGSRYQGEWKNNTRHGQGTFHWPDGESYEGQFKNDKRHGKGSYYWNNGEYFEGIWENDMRNGQGTFYNADDEVVASGMWEDDELVEMEEK